MPWFKVDDKLHDHRKARAAGKAAMGVWVLAGSWAADHLTDGFVPASILPRYGTRADAARLVKVGLWTVDEQDGEEGWRFHQWADLQPTRAQKLAEREAKVEAGRAGGKASGRSRRQAKAKQSASGQVELPSRPVPSRPTAAAAADETTAAAAADLPGSVAILANKLRAHTPLRGLRFDTLTDEQTTRLDALIHLHGDEPLVSTAIATCRNPAPTYVTAFLGTWDALPPPGTPLHLVRAKYCDIHNTRLSPAGVCSSCASEKKAADQ